MDKNIKCERSNNYWVIVDPNLLAQAAESLKYF